MIAKARDVMVKKFKTLRPDMALSEAIRLFREADAKEHIKVFGMVVVDDQGQLVGMLSMFDILLFMRPGKSRNWEGMDDVEVNKLFDTTCTNIKSTLVKDIMTSDVITVSPDTHVIKILDTMIRRYIRRLPVVEDGKILGIVYISNIFEHFSGEALSR